VSAEDRSERIESSRLGLRWCSCLSASY